MMKKILIIMAILSFFTAQAQASLLLTQNNSIIEIVGSTFDSTSGEADSYLETSLFSSTVLPVFVPETSLSDDIDGNAISSSEAYMEKLDIAATLNGYKIIGAVGSSVETSINSGTDDEATALAYAEISLRFTLSSSYNYSFSSFLSSIVELDDLATDPVGSVESSIKLTRVNGMPEFDHAWNDEASTLKVVDSGILEAGDYSLLITAYSQSQSGSLYADAGTSIDLQLTAVPLPAGLPLMMSGIFALGLKRHRDQNRSS